MKEDVFMASQFELPQLLQQQAVLNLSAYYDQDEELVAEDFYPEAVDIFTGQGIWTRSGTVLDRFWTDSGSNTPRMIGCGVIFWTSLYAQMTR